MSDISRTGSVGRNSQTGRIQFPGALAAGQSAPSCGCRGNRNVQAYRNFGSSASREMEPVQRRFKKGSLMDRIVNSEWNKWNARNIVKPTLKWTARNVARPMLETLGLVEPKPTTR